MPTAVTQKPKGTAWQRYKARERKLVLTGDRNERVAAMNRTQYRLQLAAIHSHLYDRLTPAMRAALIRDGERLGGLMKESLAQNYS